MKNELSLIKSERQVDFKGNEKTDEEKEGSTREWKLYKEDLCHQK